MTSRRWKPGRRVPLRCPARVLPAAGCALLLLACAAQLTHQPPVRTPAAPAPVAGQGENAADTTVSGAPGEQDLPRVTVIVKGVPNDDLFSIDDRMLEVEPTEAMIAEAFRSRGFPVADAAAIRQSLRKDQLSRILEGDDRAAIEVGLATEADVVVAGTVQQSGGDSAAAGGASSSVKVRLAARAVSTATGEVMGSTLLETAGLHGSDEARRRTADSAASELSAAILEVWKGRTHIAEIHAENADYERVQLFKDIIVNETPGVDSVVVRSLSARSAVLEVFSKVATDALLVHIDRCVTAVPFVVKGISGDRIDIEFENSPEQCEPEQR
jgi:hypothetical protein